MHLTEGKGRGKGKGRGREREKEEIWGGKRKGRGGEGSEKRKGSRAGSFVTKPRFPSCKKGINAYLSSAIAGKLSYTLYPM
jgi:hypothetical protein